MEYIVQSETSIGSKHKEMNIKNQDAIFHMYDKNCFVAVLADGAGSTVYAKEGATIIAAAISSYLFKNHKLLMSKSDSFIKSKIMETVYAALMHKAADMGLNCITEFGSTLMFAVSDGKRYIIGHLGDGVIMGTYNNRLAVLSFPENGENSNCTFLTTSFDAQNHLRIIRGELLDYDSFILLTDGIIPNLFNRGYSLKKSSGLQQCLLSAISSPHIDDASYLNILWRENNE